MKKVILTLFSLSCSLIIINPFIAFAITSNYGFTDQERDFETGLYNYDAREYDPNLGRFLQQDPVLKDGEISSFFLNRATQEELNDFLANPQNLNPYSYTRNNPVNYVDPTGEVVETPLDVAFITYDSGNTLYKAGQFIGSLFFGSLQQTSDASQKFLGSFVDLGADIGATLIPFVPAGLTKIDDAAKLVNKVKNFDAVAQQNKLLKGIENSKAINTIKSVFKPSDTIPGGTMGALRNEIMTGNKTKDKFHFKKEVLNKVESTRLQGISNSLKSLVKKIF